MQSCIDRAVALCKGHKLVDGANSESSCIAMEKERMSEDVKNVDSEPPLKKARYSNRSCEGLDGCDMPASPIGGNSRLCVRHTVSMEDVAHAEGFTGKSNILTLAESELKSQMFENSELPLLPKDASPFNPEQSNHLESDAHSNSRTMQIHCVHALDSAVLGTDDEVSDDDDDDDDSAEASDASKLVLSVIKTKVDIQTMKMCLQHNAESPLVNSVASIGGAATTPVSPLSLSDSQHTSFAMAAVTSSGHSGRHRSIDDTGFRPADLETVEQEVATFCQCNDSSCHVCCRDARNARLNLAARSTAYLAHWQDQHTAKAIVDNAINRTIEEMVIAPDQSDPPAANEYDSDRIQCHGLVTTAQRSVHILQQRLQPMINQLTQASDLVFARNIEQSRDGGTGRNDMP